MYAIYAYIDPQTHPNVGIYGIHGVYGIHTRFFKMLQMINVYHDSRGGFFWTP